MNRIIAGVALGSLSLPSAGTEPAREWRFEVDGEGNRLVLHEVQRPAAAPGEVVVRMRATSLNRRDMYVMANAYGPGSNADGLVPLSDGAGEVVEVGDGVTRFAVGDRVAGTFFRGWVDGAPAPRALASARGGGSGGMLAEFIVSDEADLVSIPEHLSWEEAATLPCAAVTAWVGLFARGDLEAGDWVLLEGTGGVSTFGLLFAVAADAKPVITSSSDEKLARAQSLGAVATVNYRRNPEWQQAVLQATGGAGVDHVLEVGGEDTLPKALEALASGGHVAMIGGLTGFVQDIPAGPLMMKHGRVSGIYVGSRADFEAMNAFIEEHGIRPVIDRVFDFEDAPAAFEHMLNGDFMGKIVIRM